MESKKNYFEIDISNLEINKTIILDNGLPQNSNNINGEIYQSTIMDNSFLNSIICKEKSEASINQEDPNVYKINDFSVSNPNFPTFSNDTSKKFPHCIHYDKISELEKQIINLNKYIEILTKLLSFHDIEIPQKDFIKDNNIIQCKICEIQEKNKGVEKVKNDDIIKENNKENEKELDEIVLKKNFYFNINSVNNVQILKNEIPKRYLPIYSFTLLDRFLHNKIYLDENENNIAISMRLYNKSSLDFEGKINFIPFNFNKMSEFLIEITPVFNDNEKIFIRADDYINLKLKLKTRKKIGLFDINYSLDLGPEKKCDEILTYKIEFVEKSLEKNAEMYFGEECNDLKIKNKICFFQLIDVAENLEKSEFIKIIKKHKYNLELVCNEIFANN